MFAVEQCLLCLAHHPDVWYQAAQFLDHSAKLLHEKAVSFQSFWLYISSAILFDTTLRIMFSGCEHV